MHRNVHVTAGLSVHRNVHVTAGLSVHRVYLETCAERRVVPCDAISSTSTIAVFIDDKRVGGGRFGTCTSTV